MLQPDHYYSGMALLPVRIVEKALAVSLNHSSYSEDGDQSESFRSDQRKRRVQAEPAGLMLTFVGLVGVENFITWYR